MLPRAKKKTLEGVVVSNKMQKTVVVKVIRKERHPKYEKLVEYWKKYYAHTENQEIKEGQKVRIMQTRPLSRLKRWRVVEVL